MRFIITLLTLVPILLCQAQPSAANRWTVETGVQAGDTWGVTSPSHSTVRLVGEFGLLLENSSKPERRWSWGGVLYGALGGDDFIMAIKPRIHWLWNEDWSSDLTAGYIFATVEGDPRVSDTGFAGGLTLNYGRILTLKGDVNVRQFDDWTTTVENVPQLHAGGTEVALYGGVSLRERPGWSALGIIALGFAALMLMVVSNG